MLYEILYAVILHIFNNFGFNDLRTPSSSVISFRISCTGLGMAAILLKNPKRLYIMSKVCFASSDVLVVFGAGGLVGGC